MYYVCVDKEEKRLFSILAYEPNVPANIQVVNITDEEYKSIESRTHYFSIEENKVVVAPQTSQDSLNQEKTNAQAKLLLDNTDWKVLRHLREKALGITTSMTEIEYLSLEENRQNAAKGIV